jgi:hypothetical protein
LGGGLGWKCTLFDFMKAASWEIFVEALTSNVSSRTIEIVMIFERPLVESYNDARHLNTQRKRCSDSISIEKSLLETQEKHRPRPSK